MLHDVVGRDAGDDQAPGREEIDNLLELRAVKRVDARVADGKFAGCGAQLIVKLRAPRAILAGASKAPSA